VFEEKKANLFPKSLMGTTMQEGGTRERRSTYLFIDQGRNKKKKRKESQKYKGQSIP